tara:strand:- start:238 stop:996 length:759 start_codon:yes stop_codon:yes gene_type:complete
MTETPPESSLPADDDKIISDLLANCPLQSEVVVELPSKNKFYKLLNPSDPITLRPMTFEDEKAIVSNKNASKDVLNILLGRCMTNINISDLLLFDKLYLLMKLREISYGSIYKADITCPACRTDNKVAFDLSDLEIKYVEDDMVNPVSLHLPVLKKTIKVNLPRVSDERYLNNTEASTNNLWRFVAEIEGHTKKTIISKVVKKLPLKDIHALMNLLSGQKYGINTGVRFACSYCSHSEKMELPITADFFTET